MASRPPALKASAILLTVSMFSPDIAGAVSLGFRCVARARYCLELPKRAGAPTCNRADRSGQLFRKTGGFESCGAVEEEPRPTQPTSVEPDPVKPLDRKSTR